MPPSAIPQFAVPSHAMHRRYTIVTQSAGCGDEDAKLADCKSKPPTVAVVMATFNRANLIFEAIESLLGQTRPPDEFIVINDGSTDDTASVVRRYGDRIKYLEKANGGKPAALNLVLPQVESTYTWIFDDDDVALPHALEAHLAFLSEHPWCDFTYSTNYVFSGEFSEEAIKRSQLKTFPDASAERFLLWVMESLSLRSLIPGMLIPTDCYRAVGGFDETLLRCEDVDILLRFARRFRAGFLNQPTFAERLHRGARGPRSERHSDADRYQVFRQYKRQIFGRLRDSLGLEEYLGKGPVSPGELRSLDPMEERQALLQRGVVMAIHGLFPEAVDDLQGYADQLGSRPSAPAGSERDLISKSTYVHDPDAPPPIRYYRVVGALCRGRSEVFNAAARGLYWSIARAVRRRHLSLVLRLLAAAVAMAAAYAGVPAPERKRHHGYS